MDPFASSDDVQRAWRSLTSDEHALVENHLEFASEIIRSQISDVDDRLTAGSLSTALTKHVAVQMVLRHLRNPDGLRSTSVQESIDDYSTTLTETRDQVLSAGSIYLTADERALLVKRGSRAFSIAPATEPTTCEIAERVALQRASWRT